MKKSKKLKRNRRSYRKNQIIHNKKLKRNRRTVRKTNNGGMWAESPRSQRPQSPRIPRADRPGSWRPQSPGSLWADSHVSQWNDYPAPPLLSARSSKPITRIVGFLDDDRYNLTEGSATKKEVNDANCPPPHKKAAFNKKKLAHELYLFGDRGACEDPYYPKYINGMYCCSKGQRTDEEMFDYATYLLFSAFENSGDTEFEREKPRRNIQTIITERNKLMNKLGIDVVDDFSNLLAQSTIGTQSRERYEPDSFTRQNTGLNAINAFVERRRNAPKNPPFPDNKATKAQLDEYLRLNWQYMTWDREKRTRLEMLKEIYPELIIPS